MLPLIYYVPGNFRHLENSYKDVKIWRGIFNLFTDNVCFIDRSNVIKSPVSSTSLEYTALPDLNTSFNLSFDQCAIETAKEIYSKHESNGAKIKLAWSGGIDSSVILMSFIELLGINKTTKILDVVMTQKSIMENPYLWEKIIRQENFNIVHATEFSEKWDGSEILVNGEGGDQIHGTDIYRNLRFKYGKLSMDTKWTQDLVLEYIKWRVKHFNDNEANILTEVLIKLVNHAPIKIETQADFWWWINFTCKWASVIYRLVTKSTTSVNIDFLKDYYFPFYTNNLFQQWAMTKRNEVHRGDWESYKWKAKEFIISSTGCKELDLKHRQGSLYQILAHTSKIEAIDKNFKYYQEINPLEWYCPNNSFKY